MLGCSKQNVSYWELHSDSTQSKSSIYKVIRSAAELFMLSRSDTEMLANSIGLSMNYVGGNLFDHLKFSGKHTELCANAMISERMLRYYKNTTPTKQALTAIAVALNYSIPDIEDLLGKYGYCLSESVAADAVVRWYIAYGTIGANSLYEINETLEKMGLPLLMTRTK